MPRIPALIIGAGQAGLAMSQCLTDRGIAHVVLERGRIAERWHSERWDSLRLLTPNWMSRLPAWTYQGNDPDGFMTAADFAEHLSHYARASQAPVCTETTVRCVRPGPHGYVVDTDRGRWEANAVVIATGNCDEPAVPAMAQRLPETIRQIAPPAYRNPDLLPRGGVLVVGASATGAQIADEIQRAGGRQVWLAAGGHTRVPRTYRGRDIWHWLDAIGILDDRWDAVSDIVRARRQPSFQLVGRPDRQDLTLGTLHQAGVRMLGRVMDARGSMMRFADDLPATLDSAHAALERLLARIDACADKLGAPADPRGCPRIILPPAPTALDLAAEGIGTVVWATGYNRNYRWLRVPVLDAAGEIAHDGGVTPAPGLYVLGLRFMRRRRSNFIDGVGLDAHDLAEHLTAHLAAGFRRAA
ncbi:MAG: NAD(P)-binding domain-containing protein [Acetobacteraceae bacterium]